MGRSVNEVLVAIREKRVEIGEGLERRRQLRSEICALQRELRQARKEEGSKTGQVSRRTIDRSTYTVPSQCKRGHELTPGNFSITREGYYTCLVCNRASQKRRYYENRKR